MLSRTFLAIILAPFVVFAGPIVVLDVSQEATDVSIGTLMSGKGQLWVSDLKLEAVNRETPTTDRKKSLEPGNLELKR